VKPSLKGSYLCNLTADLVRLKDPTAG
jgi:hypothetical protein